MAEVITNRIKWVPRFRIRAKCAQSGEVSQVEVQKITDALFVAETFEEKGDCESISILDRKNGTLSFYPDEMCIPFLGIPMGGASA